MDFSLFFSFSYTNSVTAGAFTVLTIIYYFYYIYRSSKSPKAHQQPPEAGGGWPIIGHLHLLGGRNNLPHKTLAAMADRYGPVFTVRLGRHRTLVVSSAEVAKECFTAHDVAVSTRPKFLAAKYFGYGGAMFGYSPYGAYWRELRKIISVELLSSGRLQLLRKVRVSETDESVKDLYRRWTEKEDESGYVMVEMKQWFRDLTLNVILRMVVGKRFFGANGGEDEEEVRRCQRMIRKLFYLLGLFVVADAIPCLGWLDLGGHEKAMKDTAKEIDMKMVEWLEEHSLKRDSGESNGEEDFMDVMYSVFERAELGNDYDADTINKATCMTLISGGTDTTTVALTWALSLVMNNPNVLKKIQDELDIHVGKKRQVDESDISQLAYLQAVVKESLRLYPAGPLGGQREFTDDCTVGGYHVRKGTRLTVNLWKLHRDPQVWPAPEEFRPERFLTPHKEVDVKGQNIELIPFGAGRRACPGTAFALQMLYLVLARLFHGFELSTPANSPVDMTESAGLTNIKATPLELLVVPRLSADLYT